MGFLDVLKKAYPFISTAASLGGPIGVMAAGVLGKVLGSDVKPGDLPKQLEDLTMSEDGRLKLDQAEKEFQITMAKMGYDDAERLADVAEKDRDSARNREIQVKDWTPRILAGVVCLFSFGAEIWVLTHGYPANVPGEVMGRILGTLDSALILVLSYYFGSSAGSSEKTATIDKLASQQK